MKRLGYIPSEPDARDLSEREALYGITIEQAERADLSPYEPSVWSQGSTNSCVAQAIAAAMYITESQALEGDDRRPVVPSRKFMYYNGRRLVTPRSWYLRDNGSNPRAVFRALQKQGAPPEALWPWSKRTNGRPGVTAVHAAHQYKGGSYFGIIGRGADRTQTVRELLTLGLPVVFGTPVDSLFQGNVGPPTVGMPREDKIIGRHMMCIVGYHPSQQHGWEYDVRNSWGTDWRVQGGFYMTEQWLQWEQVTDVWAVVGHERIRRALDKHPVLAKWRAVVLALEEARAIV